MSSYNNIRKVAAEAEHQRKAAARQAATIAQEKLNVAIAGVERDIRGELTQVGEAFGKWGLFGNNWRIRFHNMRHMYGASVACYGEWALQSTHPRHGYISDITIRLDICQSVPMLRLDGCDLTFLTKSAFDEATTTEVRKKIGELLSELNKTLSAFHIQTKDLIS